jgi:cell division protein FtsW (lipid II flippase)
MICSHASYWQICSVGVSGAIFLVLLHAPLVAADAIQTSQVVERHTDYVFVYLLSGFGRSIGALAMIATFLLFAQLVEVARNIRAETPRLVVVGVATLFGGEFAWSLFANLGFLPMPAVGMNYPLLSFGGTLLVVHLGSLGLVSSIYRRKTVRVA